MAPAFRNRSRTTSGSKKSEPSYAHERQEVDPSRCFPASLGRFFVKNPPVINMAMENPPFIDMAVVFIQLYRVFP